MTRSRRGRGGWVLLVFVIVVIALFALYGASRMPEINAQSRRGRVKRNMKAISVSIDRYFAVHGGFPPTQALVAFAKDDASILKKLDKVGGRELTSFEMRISDKPTFADLKDPFSPSRSLPYAYVASSQRWMTSSPGPDADYDLDPKTVLANEWTTTTLDLVNLTYDPTNGMFSNGDIFRMGWQPD